MTEKHQNSCHKTRYLADIYVHVPNRYTEIDDDDEDFVAMNFLSKTKIKKKNQHRHRVGSFGSFMIFIFSRIGVVKRVYHRHVLTIENSPW